MISTIHQWVRMIEESKTTETETENEANVCVRVPPPKTLTTSIYTKT